MNSTRYSKLANGPDEVQVPLIGNVSRPSKHSITAGDDIWSKAVRASDMWRHVRSRLTWAHLGHNRRLFLLIFVWTFACLFLFKLALMFGHHEPNSGRRSHAPITPMAASIMQRQARALAVTGGTRIDYSSATSGPHKSSSPKSSSPLTSSSSSSSSKATTATATHNNENWRVAHINGCRYQLPSEDKIEKFNFNWQRLVTSAAVDSSLLSSESPIASGAPPAMSSSSSSPLSAHSTSSDAPSWAGASVDGSATQLVPGQTTFHLYGAYYDGRWRQGGASVRILAMIDRIHPTPTSCLLWFNSTTNQPPVTVPATYMYAWYPKWGNYKDAILQPFIVTCAMPKSHHHQSSSSSSSSSLVPDRVTLIERSINIEQHSGIQGTRKNMTSMVAPSMGAQSKRQSCNSSMRFLSNNLRVHNDRPQQRQRFGVCVKGLEFLHDDISVRLVEWIELLHVLGAGKIFFYELDVHANISKVLRHYQKLGMVEWTKISLAGAQPNEPEQRHSYLKSHLTHKRQNELIAYNDCLYRNLYSYDYLALLDIDEVIMPLRHSNWHELMQQVEKDSLRELNYTRASYNVRNVYFFDHPTPVASSLPRASKLVDVDIDDNNMNDDDEFAFRKNRKNKPLQTASADIHEIPDYLHMMRHVLRSRNYTKPGQYVKCFHNTQRAVSLHNHFPLNCFGQCTTYSIPVTLAHLQHYRKDCVGPLRQSCQNEFRAFTVRDTTIWRYKRPMIERTSRALRQLKLISGTQRLRERTIGDDSTAVR